MQKELPKSISKLSINNLIWVITLIGAVIASWEIYLQHGNINDDSVLYLEVARVISSGNWKKALELYPWPLYPALIASVHLATGLALQASAHLLSIVLFALTLFSFGRLLKLSGGNKTTLIAGCLLLLSSTLIICKILPSIMREQGFWAFNLLSLMFFLKFYQDKRITNGLAWSMSALIAALFRVEGFTFLALLPLILLTDSREPFGLRLKHLIVANAIFLMIGFTLALALFFTDIRLNNIGRLQDPLLALENVYTQLSHGLIDKAHLMGDQVLGSFLADYAMMGLLLTLVAIIINKIGVATGWFALGICLLRKKIGPTQLADDAKKLIFWAASLHLLNILIVLLANFLLPSRLAIPVSFLVIWVAAFSLSKIYYDWRSGKIKQKTHKLLLWLFAGLILFKILWNLSFNDPNQDYEIEATTWIKTHLPLNANIFYDDARLRYYADASYIGRVSKQENVRQLIENQQADKFDYLLIHVNNKQATIEQLQKLSSYHAIRSFHSPNGKKLVLYKRNN